MSKKEKKPFYKKWWFIGLAIIFIFAAIGGSGDNDEEVEAEEPNEEVVVEAEEVEETEAVEETDVEDVEEVEVVEEEVEEEIEEEPFDPENYNKELTYDDLARNPDDHLFKKVTFEGKIVQVMQGDDSTQFRLATNDDYDKMMYIEIDNSKLDTRILEDDHIRIYGIYLGEISYESTMGGKITIPGVAVTEFEFK